MSAKLPPLTTFESIRLPASSKWIVSAVGGNGTRLSWLRTPKLRGPSPCERGAGELEALLHAGETGVVA